MTKLPSRAVIDAAKAKLRIPELWRALNLPGEPKASCRSPFRKERKASFSIFDEGRQARDHATGEDFDGPAIVAKALGLPIEIALRRFVTMAGGDLTGCDNSSQPGTDDCQRTSARSKPDLSKFRLPVAAELCAIARDRALDRAAPAIAKRLGCLRCGLVCGLPSWILTDPSGWNAEARRFGRLSYPDYRDLSERKAHTLKHSSKCWPVGLGVERALVDKATLVAVVEGGPDYLAVWHFIYRTKRWDVLPIAILGRAIHGLHPDAVARLAGKTLRFFPHADSDEGGLEQTSILAQQLRAAGCKVSYFDLTGLRTTDGALAKDLNNLIQLDSQELDELSGELFR